MHHLQHPVVADRLYEGHATLTLSDLVENVPPENDTVLIDRQALHAFRLGFDHPVTGKRLVFEAPMPSDFERVLAAVKQYRTKKTGKK
jgi:23S rRNA pseudouridine1911/1915/1917 synthase